MKKQPNIMEKSNNINKIIDHLQYSQHQYQMLKLDLWMSWCSLHAPNEQILQSLMANSALYSWWAIEYDKLETEFLQESDPYLAKIEVKELRDHYDNKMVQIANYYFKPLIKKARTLNITPQLN